MTCAVLFTAPRDCAANVERVTVEAPTRLDWTFAVARQSRLSIPAAWCGPNYDSRKQSYDLFVPDDDAGPAPPEGRSLVLFLSDADPAAGWQFWSKVCKANNAIFVAPHAMGREKNPAYRIRVVLDVLDDVRQRHAVDTDRTYLCGASEEAHLACQIAFSLPEYFGGVIAIGGGEPPPEQAWLRREVANRLSIVFAKSRRESARRKCFFESVFVPLSRKANARTASFTYSGSPQQMPKATELAAMFRWLDAALPKRRELAASFPVSRVGNDDVVSREQHAQRALADARIRDDLVLESGYASFLRLRGIVQRWPDLPAASEAERILEELDPAFLDRWLTEREATFLRTEQAHNAVYAVVFRKYPRGRLLNVIVSRYPEEYAELTWTDASPALADDVEGATVSDAMRLQLNRLGSRVDVAAHGRIVGLNLSGTLVSAIEFRKLREQLDGLKSLHALDLSSTVLRGSVLNQLPALSSLHAVDLSHTAIGNRDLSPLSELRELQMLCAVGTNLSSLGRLGALPMLNCLIAGDTKLDDRSLEWLRNVPELRKLSLFSTRVTDRGIARLEVLPKLEYLNLASTQVTNASCGELGNLPRLQSLILDGTEVTDAGLAELGEAKLRYLSVRGTQISDPGLKALEPMQTLQSIDLRKTNVSIAGVLSLQETHPHLEVVWDESRIDTLKKMRTRLRIQKYLSSVEDIYRRKLVEYQERYFGFSLALPLDVIR